MKFTRIAGVATGLALVVTAALPGVASAATETVTFTVAAGTLNLVSQPITFADTTYNGTDQTKTSNAGTAWVVTDARGTGAAWTATVSATAPTSAAGTVETTARTIPVGNLRLTTGTATAGTGSDPNTNITGASNMALSGSDQTLIASSGVNKGTYSFSPSISLLIPASAYRSNYFGAVGTALNPYISTLTLTTS
jgi:hypothetical protein